MTTPPKHPAKFSRKILLQIADFLAGLPEGAIVLDSFAGTGRIHQLQEYGWRTIGIELEPEWANMHPDTIVGNALYLPFADETIDAYATSCVYGNRMSDAHVQGEGDKSTRNTYTHTLGRKLHPDNSGAMQWGVRYRGLHTAAWAEAVRVLKPGAPFVLNIKDHYRAGSRMRVTAWHVEELQRLGMTFVKEAQLPHKGNQQGENGNLRVPYESVILFHKN